MTEKLIIELLEEIYETVLDESGEMADDTEAVNEHLALTRNFRWGFVDALADWPSGAQTGSEDDLLLFLSHQNQPATLLVPGEKVVTMAVPYNKKEARHFAKLLPYQIEDEVIGSVSDLHFSISRHKENETIPVAYTDIHWLSALLEWAKNHGLEVDTCLANFQALHAANDELLIWFTDGQILGHANDGMGFSIAQSFSQAFLKDLLKDEQSLDTPRTIKVYVADAEAKEIVETHIMPPVAYEVIIGLPPFHFEQENQLNFCHGQFGKKLPLEQWWKEAKSLAMLAAAAVVVFFVATFSDIYLMKQQQQAHRETMLTAFREAIPRGPASGPIRRLKSLLGNNSSAEQSSEVVHLLAKVAPVLDTLNINLNTLNYSNREQALRINIRAESFNGIEQLRQGLEQQGISAELQSSNAAKDGFQARIKIQLNKA